jgi:hypothetical protein
VQSLPAVNSPNFGFHRLDDSPCYSARVPNPYPGLAYLTNCDQRLKAYFAASPRFARTRLKLRTVNRQRSVATRTRLD